MGNFEQIRKITLVEFTSKRNSVLEELPKFSENVGKFQSSNFLETGDKNFIISDLECSRATNCGRSLTTAETTGKMNLRFGNDQAILIL